MAVVDDYRQLGVRPNASSEEIRTAYSRMAMKWHPDQWSKVPSQAEKAKKKKFQDVQEAYSGLSDGGKRSLFKFGLCGVDQEDEGSGFCDFLQEMTSLMETETKKSTYGLTELQGMLRDMMGGGGDPFEPLWPEYQTESSAKRARYCHGRHPVEPLDVFNSTTSWSWLACL